MYCLEKVRKRRFDFLLNHVYSQLLLLLLLLYYYILLAIILITAAVVFVVKQSILIIIGADVSHMHAIKENKRQRNN